MNMLEFELVLIMLMIISYRIFSNYFFGILCFISLVFNPLIMSVLCVESMLYVVFFLLCFSCYINKRWSILFISLAFLTLTRPDGFLLFVIFMLFIPLSMQKRLRLLLLYVSILALWYAYSWVHLGSLFPDTLIIKRIQQAWGAGYYFHNGLVMYLGKFPFATVFSFPLLPFCVFAFLGRNQVVKKIGVILAAYGLSHYLAYSILRVPPYHWYYIHQVVPCAMIGSLGMSRLVHDSPLSKKARSLSRLILVLPAIGIIGLAVHGGLPFKEPPIHTNWASHDQYMQAGLWLRDNLEQSAAIAIVGEIGTLAFYSERHLINDFSDMGEIDKAIRASKYTKWSIGRLAIGINYFWRRTRESPPYTHRLIHVPSEHKVKESDDIIATWQTSSKWAPQGRLYLWAVHHE
jgi:hypothetical protein